MSERLAQVGHSVVWAVACVAMVYFMSHCSPPEPLTHCGEMERIFRTTDDAVRRADMDAAIERDCR